jgi:hypothetical protein
LNITSIEHPGALWNTASPALFGRRRPNSSSASATRELTEAAMKRSSKVVLLFMGTAAAGGLSMESALARGGCRNNPDPPGFAMPGSRQSAARCLTRAGFGGFSHHFHGHGHGHGGHGHGG